ncbi:Uncharacterised protein [Cedecea lapagei]|uniref:Uncharacterized protein n=1 Tax=Cedecea lapagei TaxID=158823 RepID=A0A3S4JX51_9ENTR|nr:Uncharacterised protein [Cedecea lapagei]
MFQNLPNELKAKFRCGLLNYDIEACNLACLNHLFREYGVDYCVDASIYAEMMEHTGLTRKQCKSIVHTTTYMTLAQNQCSAKSEIFVFLQTPDKFSRSHVI